MTIRLLHNAYVSKSMRNLSRLRRSQAETMEKVSSGRRTPRAKFDPAGVAVVSNLDAARISKRQAIRNLKDGLALLDTADGGLVEISEMLKRMRELAVQSASEVLHDDERAYIQDEYSELVTQMNRVAVDNVWGTTNLLIFQRVDVGFVIDASASMPGEITAVRNALADFKTSLNASSIDVGLGLIENSLRDNQDSTIQLADIDDGDFITELNNMTLTGGRIDPWSALLNASGVDDAAGVFEPDALSWTENSKGKVLVSITDTNRELDLIAGAETQQDVADALAAAGIEVHSINPTVHNAQYSTITDTTGGSIQSIGDATGSGIAAAMDNIATRVGDIFGDRGITVQASDGSTEADRIEIDLPVNASASGLGLDLLDLTTATNAQDALDDITTAIDSVNGFRALVGSHTNRLDSAIRLEETGAINLASAQSQIEDADLALETAKLAKHSLLQQVAIAILGQAQSLDSLALNLIA